MRRSVRERGESLVEGRRGYGISADWVSFLSFAFISLRSRIMIILGIIIIIPLLVPFVCSPVYYFYFNYYPHRFHSYCYRYPFSSSEITLIREIES